MKHVAKEIDVEWVGKGCKPRQRTSCANFMTLFGQLRIGMSCRGRDTLLVMAESAMI